MSSLNIDINLLKLSRAGVASIHGVKCVVIPCEENDIYISQDNQTGKAKSAHLHITAWENKNGISQYGDTHYIKPSYSKEFREANAEASKNAPIIGNGKPIQSQGSAINNVAAPTIDNSIDNNDDLPF